MMGDNDGGDTRSLLGDRHRRIGHTRSGLAMTALELLKLMKSHPGGRWVDDEMDRLSGIASPGDVDPMLAREFGARPAAA